MEKQLLYFKSFISNLERYHQEEGEKRDTVKKLVFYGVKIINGFSRKQNETLESITKMFQFIVFINEIIGMLTPSEFVNIFPISKEYRGHKWGVKDYFYTRRYIDSLEVDKPIGAGDKVLLFLWEYCNWDITEFVVESMSCISDFNRYQGEPTLAQGFAEAMGVNLYAMHEDDKGNKLLIDKKGKVVKVSKTRPEYLKVVK